MKVCILTTNENIEAARASAKTIPEFANHTSLAIPCSESGEMPPTHWLCTFNASDEMFHTIESILSVSEMTVSEPRPFLKEKNLKMIPLKKVRKGVENEA